MVLILITVVMAAVFASLWSSIPKTSGREGVSHAHA